MVYQGIIIRAEKVASKKYKLITEGDHEYYYTCIDTTGRFQEEEESWKTRVLESQEILLEWIEKPTGPCPASIGWNSQGNALLEIKLNTVFNPQYNVQVSEINPFAFKDTDGWVQDPACPF